MATLIPTACECHTLELPPNEKDDRLNLNVRTGSASTIYRSMVFVYGGLTIGLELKTFSAREVNQTFLRSVGDDKSKRLQEYLSGEFFWLDLITKKWHRVNIPEGEPKPRPRLFHEICATNNRVILFGGLVLSEGAGTDALVPSNELWEFNLELNRWRLLHNGSGYNKNRYIPSPRFCSKMTAISRLNFAHREDHFGIMIAGGKDFISRPRYDNAVFDLVDEEYVDSGSLYLTTDENDPSNLPFRFNETKRHNVDYESHVILTVEDSRDQDVLKQFGQYNSNYQRGLNACKSKESLIIYSPSLSEFKGRVVNPLCSYELGQTIKSAREIPLGKSKKAALSSRGVSSSHQVVPYNLRFPCGGLFGRNIVITGFLPNEYDISIFLFNMPTCRWSRLNLYCSHEYGSHRFWGGFSWQSHHKVVLIGNTDTSRTTSSIRYFNIMVTVSLPIANILVSSELSTGRKEKQVFSTNKFVSSDEDSSQSSDTTDSKSNFFSSSINFNEPFSDDRNDERPKSSSNNPISFDDYVQYVAPKSKFTTIRSVFPAAAVTLGRNAFDRYGDLISDFEIVSSCGDRIPVSKHFLAERWGSFFIHLFASAYVKSVKDFRQNEEIHDSERRVASLELRKLGSSNSLRQLNKLSSISNASVSSSSSDLSINASQVPESVPSSLRIALTPNQLREAKEAPHFRLPFQEKQAQEGEKMQITNGKQNGEISGVDKSVSRSRRSSLTKSPARRPALNSYSSAIDPHQKISSETKISENESSLNYLDSIPDQLPMPTEPLPSVPASQSLRALSRRGSEDYHSPRGSIHQVLSTLRGISLSKQPIEGLSPRNSVSMIARNQFNPPSKSSTPTLNSLRTQSGDISDIEKFSRSDSELTTSKLNPEIPLQCRSQSEVSITNSEISMSNSVISSAKESSSNSKLDKDDPKFDVADNPLLNFDDYDPDEYLVEPSLMPRKLYLPFSSATVKAFCEYLYTGQVGNKWLFSPTALECLSLGRFLDVPLLYDLISEVLFAIIGRKELHIINEGKKLKRRYNKLLSITHTSSNANLKFPLDEYEDFISTIDDGFYDLELLMKTSNLHRVRKKSNSIASRRNKTSQHSYTDMNIARSTSLDESEISVSDTASSDQPSSTKDSSEKVTSSLNENREQETSTLESLVSESGSDRSETNLLDINRSNDVVGPKTKSVFNKVSADGLGNYMADDLGDTESFASVRNSTKSLNLEQLTTLEGAIPTSEVIQSIFETATINRDMKLMLRAANVEQMEEILEESRVELGNAIEELERQYDAQRQAERLRTDSVVSGNFSKEDLSVKRIDSASSLTPSISSHTFKKSSTGHPSTGFLGQRMFNFSRSEGKKVKDVEGDIDKRINKLLKKNNKAAPSKQKNKKLTKASTTLATEAAGGPHAPRTGVKKLHNIFPHLVRNYSEIGKESSVEGTNSDNSSIHSGRRRK